jgi:putative addiction module antidote
MEDKISVHEVDGELGVVFPPEFVERLGLAEGDTLYIYEWKGGVHLDRSRVGQEALEVYERMAAKYANALQALADH